MGWWGTGVNGVGNSADGSGAGAFGQRYDASGTAIGGEFQLTSSSGGNQICPDLVGLRNGGFAAAWTSPDASGDGVYGRVFSSAKISLAATVTTRSWALLVRTACQAAQVTTC